MVTKSHNKIIIASSFLFCLVFSSFSIKAQTYIFSGKFIDKEDNEPLIGVTVMLVNLSDTTNRKGLVSETDGSFQFLNLYPGQYKLRTSYIGYKPYERTVSISNQNENIGIIKMEPAITELGDVKIETQEIRITQKGDTTEFNANAYKTNPDASAEDLIKKMPTVTVENGTVKAQGEEVKKVLVDGREFFGDDATLALKNLPAEVIDRIQLMDKQSDQAIFTGFSDGNTEKTINIITKPGKNNGQFGKLYAGYGTEDRYIAGGNINIFKGQQRISIIGLSNNVNQQNFSNQDILGALGNSGQQRGGFGGSGSMGGGGGSRGFGASNSNPNDPNNFLVGQQKGFNTVHSFGLNFSDKWGEKITVNANYFFNNSKNTSNTLLNREYFISKTRNQFYNEENSSSSNNYNHRLNFKIEYNIDSLNSFVLTSKSSLQDNSSSGLFTGINSLFENILLNKTQSNTNSDNAGGTTSNNLLFKHKFSKKGRTVSLNLGTDYNQKNGTGILNSMNQYYSFSDSTESVDQQTNTNTNGYSLSSNLTYTEPLGKAAILQFSYNPSISKSNSEKFNYLSDTVNLDYSIPDSSLSNVYDNTVFTHKGGLSYRLNTEKYNFNMGFNLQDVVLSGNQSFPLPYKADTNFVSILPSAMLQYKFTKLTFVRLFYHTFTNTPSISQLQNVINNSNPVLLSTGNPNLNPDFSHNVTARFSTGNSAKTSSFFALFRIGVTNNYIGNSTFLAITDTVINNVKLYKGSQLTQPVNLSGYRNIRSFLTYGFPIKFLKSNLNFNAGIVYTNTPGLINDILNIAKTYNYSGGLVLGSNISEKIDFTISYSANYNTVNNTIRSQLNNNYFYQTTSAKINWVPWKKIVLNTELNHTGYTGLGAAFNQQIILWNAGIGYKFLKENAAEIKLSAFDILNKNNSISRTVTETYIEDNRTQILNRYFMFTLTYNLKKFSDSEIKNKGNGQ